MKPFLAAGLGLTLAIGLAVTGRIDASASAEDAASAAPHYDTQGRLVPPADYREWVFLSSGFDMNYSENPAPRTRHQFGNVFAPHAAYLAFRKTGLWPDKTVLMVEDRLGSSRGSINKAGFFQTGVIGLEAHVKDVTRFEGGWGFFVFDEGKPAELSTIAACYACHQDHAAADTTFVQFYPTLLPAATERKTLSRAYLAEEARDAGK